MKKYTVEEVDSLFKFNIPIQVRFSDIDGYLHVNNGIYHNYLEHARAVYLKEVCEWNIMSTGAVVANVSLDFLTPIHMKDQPYAFVRCVHIGKSSFVLEQVIKGNDENGEEKVFAVGNTTMVTVDMKTKRPSQIPGEYAAKMKELDLVNH